MLQVVTSIDHNILITGHSDEGLHRSKATLIIMVLIGQHWHRTCVGTEGIPKKKCVKNVPLYLKIKNFFQQPIQYHLQPDRGGECVVPNITVEITNIQPEHSTYAPYEPPPVYEPEPRIVPPAIVSVTKSVKFVLYTVPPQSVLNKIKNISERKETNRSEATIANYPFT